MQKNLWKKVLTWCGILAFILVCIIGFWYFEDFITDILDQLNLPKELYIFGFLAIFIIVWGVPIILWLKAKTKGNKG